MSAFSECTRTVPPIAPAADQLDRTPRPVGWADGVAAKVAGMETQPRQKLDPIGPDAGGWSSNVDSQR